MSRQVFGSCKYFPLSHTHAHSLWIDSFTYTSLSAGHDETTPPEEFVGGLELFLIGPAVGGDILESTVVITFTNDCSIAEVFSQGSSIGWVDIVSPFALEGMQDVVAYLTNNNHIRCVPLGVVGGSHPRDLLSSCISNWR